MASKSVISCNCESCGWYCESFPSRCKVWKYLDVSGITCDENCESFKTREEAARFEADIVMKRNNYYDTKKGRRRRVKAKAE